MANESTLTSICYLSKALTDFNEANVLRELVMDAATSNHQHSITGYLCMKNGFFFQYIEGPSKKINALMKNLRKDPRHTILVIIEEKQLSHRRFPSWRMRCLDNEDLDYQSIIFDKLMLINQAPRRDIRLEKMTFEAVDHFSEKFSHRHISEASLH